MPPAAGHGSPALAGWALVTVIYLVQHGEKEPGPGDPGLTALGAKQAAVTARWFRRIELAAVYSSPLLRALHTA